MGTRSGQGRSRKCQGLIKNTPYLAKRGVENLYIYFQLELSYVMHSTMSPSTSGSDPRSIAGEIPLSPQFSCPRYNRCPMIRFLKIGSVRTYLRRLSHWRGRAKRRDQLAPRGVRSSRPVRDGRLVNNTSWLHSRCLSAPAFCSISHRASHRTCGA